MAYNNQTQQSQAPWPELQPYHGTHAFKSSSMRRRLRRRDRDRNTQLVGGSATVLQTTNILVSHSTPAFHARSSAQHHGRESHSQFQPESYSPDESLLDPDDSQAHVPDYAIRGSGVAIYAGGPSTSPSPPTDKIKPVPSASSTSAEIIDALLPDHHPVLKRLPRRTASACSSSDRKEIDAEVTLLADHPALDSVPRRAASVCSSYGRKDTHAEAISALDLKGQDYKPGEAGGYPCHSQDHRAECSECNIIHWYPLAFVRHKRETGREEHLGSRFTNV